jgi:hypothetical protein
MASGVARPAFPAHLCLLKEPSEVPIDRQQLRWVMLT